MLPLRKVEQTEITHLWSATSSREIKNAGHNINQIKIFVSINTQNCYMYICNKQKPCLLVLFSHAFV